MPSQSTQSSWVIDLLSGPNFSFSHRSQMKVPSSKYVSHVIFLHEITYFGDHMLSFKARSPVFFCRSQQGVIVKIYTQLWIKDQTCRSLPFVTGHNKLVRVLKVGWHVTGISKTSICFLTFCGLAWAVLTLCKPEQGQKVNGSFTDEVTTGAELIAKVLQYHCNGYDPRYVAAPGLVHPSTVKVSNVQTYNWGV